MKFYFFVLLLIFNTEFYSYAQESKAREIVALSLKKYTSGSVLNQYIVKTEFDKLGETPSYLYQRNPIFDKLDSARATFPDSVRKKVELELVALEVKRRKSMIDTQKGHRRWSYVDLKSKKIAGTYVNSNALRGSADSVKFVKDYTKEYDLIEALKMNPVALLQIMNEDSSQLHYTGLSNVDANQNNVVQVKIYTKWLDVYFDPETYVLNKIVVPMIDRDPLFGSGPEDYRQLIIYADFQNRGDFLLPGTMEEIDTRHDLTTIKFLRWISLNVPIAASIFDPTSRNSDRKIKISDVSENLYLLESSSRFINSRSLLRVGKNKNIDILSSLSYNPAYIRQDLEAIRVKFPECKITNIYTVGTLSEAGSFSDLFSEKIVITGPKGKGFLSEARINRNKFQDSTWKEAVSKRLIITFEKEFSSENIKSLILNSEIKKEDDQINVSYYLPSDKTVYFVGNPYRADSSSKNAGPSEKLLYDLIKRRSLNVDKIFYSESYMDNAPLFMNFKDFENRIKNTDFSIYGREKR